MYVTGRRTGFPSVDKPWLQYYDMRCLEAVIPDGCLYDCVYQYNEKRLSDTFIRYMGNSITGRDFFLRVNQFAQAFETKGLKRGDVVTLMSLAIPEMLYCVYALNYLGAVINSIPISMSDNEIRNTLTETGSKLFIVIDVLEQKIDRLADSLPVTEILVISIADSFCGIKKFVYRIKNHRQCNSAKMISLKEYIRNIPISSVYISKYSEQNGDAVAFIMYTSGTTGIPKGVELTNRAINSIAIQYMYSMEHKTNESMLCFIPPFFSIGFSLAMHMPLVLGLTLEMYPNPEPGAVSKYFIKVKPNHFVGAPSNNIQIVRLLRGDCSYIKTFAAGGASAGREQEEYADEILKSCNAAARFITGYGMTEFSATVTTASNDVYRKYSLGIPLPLANVKVISTDTQEELRYGELGELCFTSPGNMKGYFHQKEETEKIRIIDSDGTVWYRTGDLGRVDEDGFVYFHGRLKRIYLKKGQDGTLYKIFPQRLEEALISSELVKECAVVVTEDKNILHRQTAFVVFTDKGNAMKDCVDNIRCELEENVPEYMLPEKIISLDEMKYQANGKIDYTALKLMSIF